MNKKWLKIALYVGELPATTFINRLAEGLAKSEAEVTLYGLIKKKFSHPKKVRISGAKDGWKEGRSSKYIAFKKYSLLLTLFKSAKKKKIDTWLQQNKYAHWGVKSWIYPLVWDEPNIIHVQWAKAIRHFGWTKELDIKLILSLRGAHINYSPLSIPGLAESYQSTFPMVDAFHGVSKAICHEATKYGADFKKCRVVYSGFNLNQFPVSNWKNDFKGLPDRPIQIISVGRAHWKKGYHIALDAMKQLKDAGFSFQYTIIGALGDEELLFQKNQLHLDELVDFSPNVPFSKVKEMIGGADVFLLPSVEEGIANVVIEAMLLGTLVITTDCGGMTETVTHGETSWVVPVRNPQAIAQAIKEVKNTSPERLEKMVLAARQKAEVQHNEERMVGDMLALYSSVMKS